MLVSITVTYHPDLAALERQLVSLKDQVDQMLVVDNGSPSPLPHALGNLCERMGATLHLLPTNTGIGHAQNLGIQHALQQDAQWLLLFDQDSVATPRMATTLRQALEECPDAAAAGAQAIDQRTGHSSFLQDHAVRPRAWVPPQHMPHDPVEVGFLISSGSLIRASALDSPTPMRADWFIDHIDSEWCLRIRSQGWKLLGVPNAHVLHRLGDEVTRVWLLRWRHIAHHSPLRDYYMFRNSIFLVKQTYLPWRWRWFFVARLFQYAGFFLLFVPQRHSRARMMAQGIFVGLRNRTGAWA